MRVIQRCSDFREHPAHEYDTEWEARQCPGIIYREVVFSQFSYQTLYECPRCSAMVADTNTHDYWHRGPV